MVVTVAVGKSVVADSVVVVVVFIIPFKLISSWNFEARLFDKHKKSEAINLISIVCNLSAIDHIAV